MMKDIEKRLCRLEKAVPAGSCMVLFVGWEGDVPDCFGNGCPEFEKDRTGPYPLLVWVDKKETCGSCKAGIPQLLAEVRKKEGETRR